MQLPANIGKYELQEFLGGGMSHVYKARDTVIGRTVAVKVLTDAGCQDSEVKARFLAEARMAGNLVHDNILSIYDFGVDELGRPFMVMEFLRGEDLRHAIKNGHTGDLKSKLKIAVQVARSLQYIHTQKIVHRDIKPENVHINTAGVVKLMDFGIAKTEGLAMTRAGYVLGTPYYMAPEQVTGQGITEQVDVYAFGILLFEILTGNKPISGDAVERIFYSILNEPLNLDPMHQAGVPQALCDVVAVCTAKNPAERPQGFAPVVAELERFISELDAPTMVIPSQPQPTQIVQAPPPARPAWMIPAILAAVVGLATAGYFVFKPKPVDPVPQGPVLAKTLTLPSGDMVLVPGGSYLSGPQKTPANLPAFYVDKTEVTNRAYVLFCKETNRDLPAGFPHDKPDYPVVNVSILDAQAFAKWAGKRLPRSAEWEKAARGEDGRMFPWGNDKDASKANLGSEGLRPAADFANGASPYGALQMVGNAWEWVYDLTQASQEAVNLFKDLVKPPPTANDPWYVIRGDAFNKALDEKVIFDVATVPAVFKAPQIGFRCIKDP